MGRFGNKFNKVNEFDNMRQALAKTGTVPTGGANSQTGAGTTAGGKHDSRPVATSEAVTPAVSAPRETSPAECLSIVSAGASWQGTLKIDGSARIDGELSGEIEARDTVHISEDARVDAKVKAAVVVIAGTFQGQANCSERLELLPLSHIQGELRTKALKIHEGAVIDGQIQMTGHPRRNGAAPTTAGETRSTAAAAVVISPASDGLPAS